MKKLIFTSAVLVVICVANVRAQDSLRVRSFIARKFETEFEHATNVEWTLARRAYVAVFDYRNEVWLAFYNSHGEKLASGRRVKDVRDLPLKVQLGIYSVRRRVERNYGPIATSFAIELMEYGITRYYVPMQNNGAAFMICSDNEGRTTIAKKQLKIGPASMTESLIASSK
jgi:hypothetical protein